MVKCESRDYSPHDKQDHDERAHIHTDREISPRERRFADSGNMCVPAPRNRRRLRGTCWASTEPASHAERARECGDNIYRMIHFLYCLSEMGQGESRSDVASPASGGSQGNAPGCKMFRLSTVDATPPQSLVNF